jgi:hypothetical protein
VGGKSLIRMRLKPAGADMPLNRGVELLASKASRPGATLQVHSKTMATTHSELPKHL